MSEIVNEEYFYQINSRMRCFDVCHIIFNPTHPNGYTRLVFRATFGNNGMFTYKRAESFVKMLVKEFNSHRFRNRRVY